MYLSQLMLDPRSRDVQKDLANRYDLHRTLAKAFLTNYTSNRLLYRLEISGHSVQPTLLLQSFTEPDWSDLKAGYLYRPARTKSFDYHIQAGDVFAFRLVANPTKRMRGEGEIGKRVALYKYEDQLDWIRRKAQNHGFKLTGVSITNLGDALSHKYINKASQKVIHHGVRFEGYLQVVDASLFYDALTSGIGSGKGFGFGLLSIARC